LVSKTTEPTWMLPTAFFPTEAYSFYTPSDETSLEAQPTRGSPSTSFQTQCFRLLLKLEHLSRTYLSWKTCTTLVQTMTRHSWSGTKTLRPRGLRSRVITAKALNACGTSTFSHLQQRSAQETVSSGRLYCLKVTLRNTNQFDNQKHPELLRVFFYRYLKTVLPSECALFTPLRIFICSSIGSSTIVMHLSEHAPFIFSPQSPH